MLFRLAFLLVRRKLNLSRLGFLRGKQSFFSCVECVDGTCNDNMLDRSTKMINHNTRRVIGRAILNEIPLGRVRRLDDRSTGPALGDCCFTIVAM